MKQHWSKMITFKTIRKRMKYACSSQPAHSNPSILSISAPSFCAVSACLIATHLWITMIPCSLNLYQEEKRMRERKRVRLIWDFCAPLCSIISTREGGRELEKQPDRETEGPRLRVHVCGESLASLEGGLQCLPTNVVLRVIACCLYYLNLRHQTM